MAAATRAARLGGSAAVHGDLAGLLGQFTKYAPGKAGVTQGLGDLEAIRLGLTAGRGDDSPLTAQLLKTAGSLAGDGLPVGDMKELAALIGVTSLSGGPLKAGTRAEQLVRGLRSGMNKAQGGYLKEIGITEGMGLVGGTGEKAGMMDLLSADLKKAEASGRPLEATHRHGAEAGAGIGTARRE